MLEVQDLMVFFENALALNDFSMSVPEGSIVGVIGSNSAGKTTLMNTVSGLILDMKIKEQRRGGMRITVYGKVLFRGEDISAVQPHERVRKGLVLSRERHPIFPESDVAENLKIAGHRTGKPRVPGDGGIRLQSLPGPDAPQEAQGGIPQRRRAADAGHQHGPHRQAGPAHAG